MAYKAGKTINDYDYSGSEYYEKGYRDGFNAGYNVAKQKEYYYKLGQDKGYNMLELNTLLKSIPKDYQESFTNGYNVGLEQKKEELKKQANKQGYEDGTKLVEKKPPYDDPGLIEIYNTQYKKGYEEAKEKIQHEAYETAYKLLPMKSLESENENYKSIYTKSYELGYQDKLASIEKEGYQSAYKHDQLMVPKKYKNIKVAAERYKKGFKKNKKAKKIKEEAYDDGFWFIVSNKKNKLNEYYYAKTIYELYYDKGKKAALELYGNIAFVGSPIAAIAAGAIYSRKRKLK